jgi:predicted peptidase
MIMRALLIASLIGTCSMQAASPEAREWKAPDGTLIKFRWSIPEKTEPGKTYPLVLFLHGSGERGSDNKSHIRHSVMRIIQGGEKLNEPCFLIAPQCPEDEWWAPFDSKFTFLSDASKPNKLLDAIIVLTDEIMADNAIDRKRFYVTGLSMGGFATWDLLGRIPEKIAAAVPICGGGDPSLAVKFKDVPIFAFHGDMDSEVPVAATREMIAALERAGGKPKVTYYPGLGHVCWHDVYKDPETLRWMFAQRRK